MRLISALFTLIFFVVCAALLIPVLGFALALSIPVGAFLIWLLPILIILGSDRTTGGEKLAWILAIVFLSWFAWIFYFLLAPIKERTDYRRYRYY
jgi:Phospholipase_D-nuclease N-terminal